MSISIDNWHDFMFKVGEDFYEFIHGVDDNATQYTKVEYPYTLNYTGVYSIQLNSGSSYDYGVPYLCDFALVRDQTSVITGFTPLFHSNQTSGLIDETYFNSTTLRTSVNCANSFTGADKPYWIGSDNYVWKRNASDTWYSNIFRYDFLLQREINGINYTLSDLSNSGQQILLSSNHVSLLYNYNGYDYYLSQSPQSYNSSSYVFSQIAPSIVDTFPVILNSTEFNVNASVTNSIKNIYTDNSTTNQTYTYNIDNNNYITVNYPVDGDGLPTGYIDIQPNGDISFDDLFDMFNTILAPLVGVGLDMPDWTDYEPQYPIVTGDINVNIDIPDVTGEYPVETITPIESDVYNIMSIDSMPQLPSLTGIDNGESAAALGSSFTFLDGCGLLMPFVTIAIIRLLISKFRGDS